MTPRCRECGCTESEVIADAKTIGVYEQFQSGVYTCCQITAWAYEQWSAWFEAINRDANFSNEVTANAELQPEAAVVPVRFRQPVPWFRNV